MEIKVPRSEAVTASRSDRDRVGEQAMAEVEHLEGARVFGLAARGIIATRHQDRQPIVGRHAHLMRKYPRSIAPGCGTASPSVASRLIR